MIDQVAMAAPAADQSAAALSAFLWQAAVPALSPISPPLWTAPVTVTNPSALGG